MKERSPQGTRAKVATTTTLDAAEEKVIRMRHGLEAPDDLELEQVGQDRPDVAAKLREIELRALRMSGRLEELQQEVGLDPVETNPGVKEKIISKLQDS